MIFDLDGTLFDLPVDWRAVRAELAPALGDRLDGASVFQAIDKASALGSPERQKLFSVIDATSLRRRRRRNLSTGR